MKITIATGPIYPVPAVLGGSVQRIWHGLAHEFVRCGHNVTIFAKAHPGQAKEEVVDGIRFVRWGGYSLSTNITTDLVRCFLYAARSASRVPPGDVVVANDFWTPAVLPLLNRSAGPVVACIQRFPKKQFSLYRGCCAIVAVSEAVAEAIREQTPSLAPKIYVVPNNLDNAFLEKRMKHRAGGAESETRDGAKHGKKPVRILFAGRLHPEKGLELLMKGLHRLGEMAAPNSWECEIIGPVAEAEGGGGEAYASQIRRVADGLPVTFTPPVYGVDELCSVYDRADIFVYPSLAERGESFGLAPLEAMARGLAPVVSALSVFGEYLRDGENGIVFNHRDSDSAQHLALALAGLIASPEKRRSISEYARATALRFSPSAVAGKYLDLFQQITR